mgnify:FL=1
MRTRRATIVADLGFGDAGKGSIIDFLARESSVSAVVRFNGGGQAHHNVVTQDGRHHTFSQFGSGTFHRGVRTHLSRFMLLDPVSMEYEAKHLTEVGCGNPFNRLSIDGQALVVTPFHKAGNRLREVLRGRGNHGTCGMGIGETMADSLVWNDAIRAIDLEDREGLEKKLTRIQERKREEFKSSFESHPVSTALKDEVRLLSDPAFPASFAESLRLFAGKVKIVAGNYLKHLAAEGNLLFEGAQGVLLDEWHGFHPYTTWSTTTFHNALALLREIGYDGQVEKLGVLRAYMTRHGPGPFVTEDTGLTIAIPDLHNGSEGWQGGFRVGWLDFVTARYALAVSGGADSLAITNLDRLAGLPRIRACTAYCFEKGALRGKEVRALSGYSGEEGGPPQATSLRPKEVLTDLSYQETLTGILGKATPLYEDMPKNDDLYLEAVERNLSVPVSIVSYGPTARDKSFHAKLKLTA